MAISAYTGPGYRQRNQGLRTGGADAEEFNQIRAVLDLGFQKLAPHEGQISRRASLPLKVLEEYQVGKIIPMAASTSTSLDNGFTSDQRFIIQSRNGCYIAPFSDVYCEYEVLFVPGANFKNHKS